MVTEPVRAHEALSTIAKAANDGLSAMRGDVVTDLGALLRRTRAAGLEITADIGDLDLPGLLGAEERALVCRIVQEALTNVLRHAPGAGAVVRVRREDVGVTVEVDNTAPGLPGGGTGSRLGLIGLRDLVAARSGQLRWGPRDDGGFRVWASIPSRQIAGALR
jgi:signal transduction histidine kinase